ncbi:hypothetical protein [uncultured Bacteroides sp.]|uniref:hypothetical protein n=1 Tax=uncultured Bacteroides sp. TaxID=162156 RepID=UPI0023D38702|nr:hypothetical protein [uncultured Bacteroides sp.]MDE5711889.1 hypothetical protein [Bacteroides sp.]MDE5761399.1 hypothetical protein [Bacteroides sp.]
MIQQKVLSSKFNMSLGFVPVILSILLSELIAQDIAICIGAGTGVLLSLHSMRNKKTYIPPILLYCTTGMLLLLSVMTLILNNYHPYMSFPFVQEICVLIPPFILYHQRNSFLKRQTSPTQSCCKRRFAQGAEATIVSARVVLIMSLLHLLIILCSILLSHPLGDTTCYILFHIAPPLVFIASILFNQFGISYFNTVMNQMQFVPIVNIKGEVIGKAIASETVGRKNAYIYPVVRIAVVSHGMLFLRPRSGYNPKKREKTDLLIEDYLIYGENLQEGVQRILRHTLPTVAPEELCFNFMHHVKNKSTNRLVYLFTLDLKDDSLLQNFANGKLWTLRQIEHNLGKGFFSDSLELEFEQLKTIIYTREKYKES